MRRSFLFAPFRAMLLVLVTCGVLGAADVQLELVTQQGFPLTGAQRWIEALKDLDVQLTIRAAAPTDRPEVVRGGTPSAPVYRVKGILTRQDTLVLPGGQRFTTRDRGRIAAWITQVRSGGLDGDGGGKPSAFGLSAEELVQLHEALAVRLRDSTKGQDPKEVVRMIAGRAGPQIVVAPAARGAFNEGDPVHDELRGVSCGTALAAVVRPLGLVVVPHKEAGRVVLVVVDSRQAGESWPVGWPPETKERELVPKLYEFLPVEITDAPLSDALEAVRERLDVPLLFDLNSLVRHRIDPATVRVSLPVGRSYYKKALDRLLFQGKLKAELRVDEANEPFLWISTVKR